MTARIEGHEYTVSKIFSDDFSFNIPMFQRPYAWGTEEAGALLDDLVAASREKGELDSVDPYFLGSLVLIKEPDRAHADVVDGQQRLTTLTILLSCLRHTLGTSGDELDRFLFQKGSVFEGKADQYRLTTRERDADFFRRNIQKSGGLDALAGLDPATLSDPRRCIHGNAMLFMDRLKNIPESDRKRLTGYIIQRCFLVAVSTPTLDSAYRIFNVLNERGLDLSHADILKSELIGKIGNAKQQDEYAKRWEDMEEALGREGFDELFVHTRMIYGRNKLRETILKGFREEVLEKLSLTPDKLIDEILAPFAESLQIIRECSYAATTSAERVNQLLGWLLRVEHFDWRPAAMLYLSRNRSNSNNLVQFLADLERLACSVMLRRLSVNERIDRYASVIAAIVDNKDVFSDSSPLQLNPDERKDTLAVLTGPLYQSRGCKYVLGRLDEELSGGELAYRFDRITVEHVLPQNPDGTSEWVHNFDDASRKVWTHSIANLLLLSRKKNSKAQNYDFDKKKEKYFSGRDGSSPFAITSQVLHQTKWTQKSLESRQKDLLERLAKLWRLEPLS